MDKKIKKPYIPFQKKKLFSSMMVKFSLILFLILICYISYFGYVKTYKPLRLSKFQYNTYKGVGGLLTGDTDLPEGITRSNDFTYAKNLGQCPHGSCVIDKKSGIKRCPEYVSDSLVYNVVLEACTKLETCDYEELPFAVRSDGNSDENTCEKDSDGNWVPCRCTNSKRCKPNIISKFTVISGDRFGEQQNNTSRNFQIASVLGNENQNQLGYFNIEIDSQDDFCSINPSFTNMIVDGCNFKNAVQDKLGCEYISNLNFESANTTASSWIIGSQKYGDFYSNDTPGYNGNSNYTDDSFCKQITAGNNFLVLIRPEVIGRDQVSNYFLPKNNGYLKIVGLISTLPFGKKSTQIISYTNRVDGLKKDINGIDYIGVILLGIKNIKTDPQVAGVGEEGIAFPFLTGLSKCNSLRTSNLTVLTVENITNTYCRFSNNIPNYKNLLSCTQNNNNICKYGDLTYQIDNFPVLEDTGVTKTDDSYTRSFCQLNPVNDPDLKNQEYLNDPVKYNLSCSIGQGCNGYNFPLNTKDISREAQTRYFPDVDIDAVRGSWDLSTSKFPVINAKSGEQLLNNNNISPGDFWSIKTVNENLLPLEDLTAGQSTIKVENLFGLGVFVNSTEPGSCIYPTLAPKLRFETNGTSYRLLRADYYLDGNETVSSIGISPGLSEGVSAFTPINVYTDNFSQTDTYGIVTIKKPGLESSGENSDLVLSRLDGTSIGQIFPEGVKVNLDLYKQFSFSGANYNTKVTKNDPEVSFYGNFNRRLYLNGKNIAYQFLVSEGTSATYGKSTYPYPPQDIFQLNINLLTIVNPIYNSSFSSISAPYKIPMSMYYPVWNQATYQQECVRCKPLLLAFPELNNDEKIENVVVQFSGKDFRNYEYDKQEDNYCYVNSSFVKFENTRVTNTSVRLFLKEPNLNIMVGDYVLDSTLQLENKIISEVSEPGDYEFLQIVPQIFPSNDSVKSIESSIFQDNLDNMQSNPPRPPKDTYPFSFGIEESTSTNYSIEGTFYYPNMKGYIKVSNNKTEFIEDTTNMSNNYFFGKKYQPSKEYNAGMNSKKSGSDVQIPTNGFYFRPVRKVIDISSDKTSVVLDSPYPYEITQPQTGELILQFCRLDSPLKLKTSRVSGEVFEKTELKVGSISDSRITNITVKKSDIFLRNNLPVIQVDTERQNFI